MRAAAKARPSVHRAPHNVWCRPQGLVETRSTDLALFLAGVDIARHVGDTVRTRSVNGLCRQSLDRTSLVTTAQGAGATVGTEHGRGSESTGAWDRSCPIGPVERLAGGEESPSRLRIAVRRRSRRARFACEVGPPSPLGRGSRGHRRGRNVHKFASWPRHSRKLGSR